MAQIDDDFEDAKGMTAEDSSVTLDKAFAESVQLAYNIVGEVFPKALSIASRHDLMIGTNRRLPTKTEEFNAPWVVVLTIDNDDRPEYRVGFSVHVSKRFSAPGTVRIWWGVTDLRSGDLRVATRENLPLGDLRVVLSAELTRFDLALQNNAGLDPLEEARKRQGTAYYWWFRREDGCSTFYTSFDRADDGLAIAEISDDDGDGGSWSGEFGDPPFQVTGTSAKDCMLQIEAEYERQRKNLHSATVGG